MSNNQDLTRVQSMWGVPILDAGFTNLPNLLIRNYTRVGLTHAEFCLVNIILTFKHDTKDPHPSQETIARIFFGDKYEKGKSERAVRKHLKNIEDKELMLVGFKNNEKGRSSCVYNFKPLIDAVLKLAEGSQKEQKEENVTWKKKKEKKEVPEQKVPELPEQKVPQLPEQKVPQPPEQKVPTKKKIEKALFKKKNEKENLSIEKEIMATKLPVTTKRILVNNIDRLIVNNISVLEVLENYEMHRDETGIKLAQYNSALKYAFQLDSFKKGFDYIMAKNVTNQIEFAKQNAEANTKTPNKPVREEKVPQWLKDGLHKKDAPKDESYTDKELLLEAELLLDMQPHNLKPKHFKVLNQAGLWNEAAQAAFEKQAAELQAKLQKNEKAAVTN